MLDTITELSHVFGTPTYVLGGGGNTSCKDDGTLWIKPSGTTLAGLTSSSFIAMDRASLGALYSMAVPTDATARETRVKDAMASAVKPETPGRASVEAPVHNAFEARYVVHTHPAEVNGLTCALGAAAAVVQRFPDALWLPFIDPGYALCLRVRTELADYRNRHGREPRVMLLENHGVFVAADTAEEIYQTYAGLLTSLREAYDEAGVSIPPAQVNDQKETTTVTPEVSVCLKEALGAEAEAILAARFDCCKAAIGPLSPDHIVYAKSFPYEGVLRPELLKAWRERRGYAPRVILDGDTLYGLGPNTKVAELALTFARDAAQVRHLARAFGGANYLSDAARSFIENWEVESYRSQQLTNV